VMMHTVVSAIGEVEVGRSKSEAAQAKQESLCTK
jgi:hypothetical protein